MTSMRRRYVASTSLRRHVPAGNLPPPPLAPLNPPPPPNILNLAPTQYSKPSYAYAAAHSSHHCENPQRKSPNSIAEKCI